MPIKPQYSIKERSSFQSLDHTVHRGSSDIVGNPSYDDIIRRPDFLVITLSIPYVKDYSKIDADLQKRLLLFKYLNIYSIVIKLPYPVIEDSVEYSQDLRKKQITFTVKVEPSKDRGPKKRDISVLPESELLDEKGEQKVFSTDVLTGKGFIKEIDDVVIEQKDDAVRSAHAYDPDKIEKEDEEDEDEKKEEIHDDKKEEEIEQFQWPTEGASIFLPTSIGVLPFQNSKLLQF
ncbi:hypothetical protein ADUPG1_007668 [Aduncisulcus paluster]|uniref:PIH1 N-terminal domain-containing protein n=1 Tax=Aduncisulcus paluster TaxID=2918883 RepID=A0ABQ5KP60_9EUKA|nr:hypothetical protein ADUPG1_007668 [Aduncisulcus paluster]